MTHTAEQLQGMSDAKINEAVALKLGMVINNYCGDAVMCGFEGLRSTFADRDYCNNPNDIMPLAFERGISINIEAQFDYPIGDGEWVASECVCPAHGMTLNVGGKWFTNDNPLRAIACLLLLISE